MRFGILSAARSARYAVPADEAFSAIEQSGETWCESDVHRIAGGRGEIAWLAPEPDISKAETHFEQALAIARQQQAKSWAKFTRLPVISTGTSDRQRWMQDLRRPDRQPGRNIRTVACR
jgi:hypothetical protein